MKKFLLLAFLFASFLSYGQSALFQTSLWMKDGDEQVMVGYPDENPCREQEIALAQKYVREVNGNPVLKAIGMDGLEKKIGQCLEESFSNAYSEYSFYQMIFWPDGIKRFLRKISGTEKVRELLFSMVSDALCDLCRIYPGDFKDEAVRVVKHEMEFVGTMNWHSYGVNQNRTLLVDGKEEYELPYSLDGFLVRRVIFDGITVRELSVFLERLLAKLDAVDVSGNGDILKRVRINNSLSYCTALRGCYYMANATGKTIFPYKEETCAPSLIQCIGDEGSYMYKISNGYLQTDPVYEWVLYQRPDDRQILLVDHTGSTIFRE